MKAPVLCLLLIVSGVDAATPSPLALDCLACHRPKAQAAGDAAALPSLAGLDAAAIEQALRAARDEPVPGAVMPRFVAKMDDATLARVAAEVARLVQP